MGPLYVLGAISEQDCLSPAVLCHFQPIHLFDPSYDGSDAVYYWKR